MSLIRHVAVQVDLQPLLPQSYASRLQSELGRRLKRQPPTAFYATLPTALFPAAVAAESLPGWSFMSSKDGRRM